MNIQPKPEQKVITFSIHCHCGKLKGTLNRTQEVNRCVCYCADCQAFARFLKREDEILDEMGGTSIIQTIPANIRFTEGIGNLSCMSLTENGMLRWYAGCCNTPIGNTLSTSNLSFIGLIHNCLSSEQTDLDNTFGPIKMYINTKSAFGERKPKSVGELSVTLRVMAQYNSWVNNKIYDLVTSLSEEERQRNLGTFFRSIHGTLNHILLADRAWLGRFSTSTRYTFPALQEAKLVFKFDSLAQILYADFAELCHERIETDKVIEKWMQELEPEILSTRVHYSNISRGIEREHSLWFGLTHFFNHQTHHRSQVTTLIYQLGQDYGVTDFLAMYDFSKEFV
jgi:uncharacterized damage-inducible protein DinB